MAIDEELKEELKDFGLGVLVTGVAAFIPVIGTPVAVGAGAYTVLEGRKLYKKLKKSGIFKKIMGGRDDTTIDKYFKPKEEKKD